jgi:tetratricopeptide (TPR) repeat protein
MSGSSRRPVWIRWLVAIVIGPFRAIGELLGLVRIAKEYGDRETSEARRLELRHRRMGLLFGLPAFLTVFAVISVSSWAWASRSSVLNRYLERASDGLTQSLAGDQADLRSIETLGNRIFDQGVRTNPELALEYCKLLAKEQRLEQANIVIAQLAPNNAPGYRPAHAQRAIAFSNLLTQGASPSYLPTLLWHLQQAGQPESESLWLAWANYYRLEGKLDQCVQALESAAVLNPSHWFSVADLYVLDQKPELAKKALANGVNAFRLAIARDPLSIEDRVQLALAQARGGDTEQANGTLKTGLELLPGNQSLLNAQAQLALANLERRYAQAKSVREMLDVLRQMRDSMKDPTGVYERVVDVYRAAKDAKEKESVFEYLSESLETKGPDPTLHFTRSILEVIEERIDDAKEDLETALKLKPDHGSSLNNLAWLLATREPRDVQRAKLLARKAIETNEQIATYRDTLGAILLESNEIPEAIEQLESALARTAARERYKLHQKLARAYGMLGNERLAKLHQDKSEPAIEQR